MKTIIETLLTIGTLAGYIILTMYDIKLGAAISLLTNLGWIHYAENIKSPSVFIVNTFFAVVNIVILGR